MSPSPKPTAKPALKLALTLGTLLGLGLIAVIFWLKPPADAPTANPKPNNSRLAAPSASVASALPSLSKPASAPSALPPLPRSLQGTQVDGDIIIDENKQLVVTLGLRRLFDYFLTAQGEEPLATIRQRVLAYIQSHTPEPAASQAITIFNQYLQYLQAVADLEKTHPQQPLDKSKQGKLDIAAISQQQQAVKAIRQRLFDEKTRQAFFASEDALNDYTLQVITTQQDPTLSDTQKQQALQQAREVYIQSFDNPQLQQKLRAQDNIDALLTETLRLKQQGASEAELTAMRRKYVDEAAVQRLSQLDKQEQLFLTRINQFNAQRQQILQQYGDTAQSQTLINALMREQFNDSEQKRLDAYLK